MNDRQAEMQRNARSQLERFGDISARSQLELDLSAVSRVRNPMAANDEDT